MDNIVSCNIRGLNGPDKQDDVKIFLHTNKIRLAGLLEMKVKLENMDAVASRIFPGWTWIHNSNAHTRGRILLAWKPNIYQITPVYTSEQLIHCSAVQLTTNEHFYITYVYGKNQELQRQQLWSDLHDIAQNMSSACCLIGDFNTNLSKEGRIGGLEVQDQDVRELTSLLEDCELHELRSTGVYFSWTNKTIYSRIDHVFLNDLWYDIFDYTHSHYMAMGLSDHTPIMLQFPTSPKPATMFQFCNMWSQHPDFQHIIASKLHIKGKSPLHTLYYFLDQIKPQLGKLNRTHFYDLKEQQIRARHDLEENAASQEKEARANYLSILNSSLALIRQQSKCEWLKYGDECSRLFFAQAKKRKIVSYIYSLKDAIGVQAEGFKEVGHLLFKFYEENLGQQERKPLSEVIISQGLVLTCEQQLSLCVPFTDKDIKEAIFSIPNHKSPGPDGYSSGFFKTTWAQTGPMVCSAACA
ncbi:LOW QUALITY PROTEIN: hypothetical protein Cgig2_025977 [Carnegiea gigantea]|uniref:Endonuclease/exonuclease/phosphatase domain-containing protein n=1 Tax=Carnegiea gigantea TaxID=171969 RepID=A0A9Q1JFD3_9CARY|nr:LOW QUALITY PROTEIN: hypothetical protein Cgig2_025977 [Carnegiea gigantea]